MVVLAFGAPQRTLDDPSPEFFELNCEEPNEFLVYV